MPQLNILHASMKTEDPAAETLYSRINKYIKIKHLGGCWQVTCNDYTILYERLEHPHGYRGLAIHGVATSPSLHHMPICLPHVR